MTKPEIVECINELRANISYEGVSTAPLFGCGLDDFEKGKYIRKEVIVNHLQWQCRCLDNNIDEEELVNCIHYLKDKRVRMC